MKKVVTRLLVIVAVTALVAVFSGGCTKKPVIPPESDSQASSSTSSSSYPTTEDTYSENNLAIEGTLDDSSSAGDVAAAMDQQSDEYKQMHGRSSSGLVPVYFDFDQAIIRPDMADRMILNAEYLKQVPNTVIIEGNCDDRGTKEYNLALGEKRAINVRDYLIDLGVEPGKIRTVSYGEERPLFFEQTDFAWSQNRRADFVIE
ncbi:MAG: OmpA family protein [Desulfofustis sp.]|nr:OmpA family protein [Desulfofustis sp.]RZW20377.1 MAG: OmpA family protein [Desulfobulbaceae bacterium]MBT8347062.1 OmpA family protein [Desulfofustis sp.]MBT8355522.1 OmpA family protein [Desulfofustis sp.]NNF46589.1 OmpA family protein [Desulfofustis sp.]